MQNNQLSTNSPFELKDNAIMVILYLRRTRSEVGCFAYNTSMSGTFSEYSWRGLWRFEEGHFILVQ